MPHSAPKTARLSPVEARGGAQPLPAHETVSVLGVPLGLIDYEGTMDWIDAAIAGRHREYVCAVSVHGLVACQDDAALRDAVLSSSLAVPDGQPLVWAINALGHDLDARVYGPELMERYCARAARTGTRMYLYGGRNQGALVQLALNLRRRHPGLKIVGGYSPPYRPLSDEEQEAIATEIDRSGADVVWVGIGVPKQEKWMAHMRPRLRAPVLIGVGAAFDFHAGLIPQAPDWVQSAGLEWAYRMAHEPRRLFPRYARCIPRFLMGFARQYMRHRLI
jgi:N-acetylglucosaminyldiphosphoundecaprenol N-acetyl-beta-D-mannosaminyltransferase